jgi:hypothetical protein
VRPAIVPFLVAPVLACGVCALAARAGEPRRKLDMGRAFDGGVAPSVALSPAPADPPAMIERAQWVFDLRWDRGDVWLLGVRKILLPVAQATPRVMGRFALELFEGPALIERVRFDFPMLAVTEAADAGKEDGPSLTQKLRTRIGIVFPATSRGTRLELLDRATGHRWSLTWPVEAATLTSPSTE